jgi:hypothetical protein
MLVEGNPHRCSRRITSVVAAGALTFALSASEGTIADSNPGTTASTGPAIFVYDGGFGLPLAKSTLDVEVAGDKSDICLPRNSNKRGPQEWKPYTFSVDKKTLPTRVSQPRGVVALIYTSGEHIGALIPDKPNTTILSDVGDRVATAANQGKESSCWTLSVVEKPNGEGDRVKKIDVFSTHILEGKSSGLVKVY